MNLFTMYTVKIRRHRATKTQRGVEVQLCPFLTSKLEGAAFIVTHFESRITHLLYTAINTTEHGQVSQCLGFTKSLTSSIQRLGDVLHDNQDNAAISQVHLP